MYRDQYKNVKEYLKRKKGIITIKNLLIILAILLLCISIGYSYFNTTIRLTGTVSAKKNIINYTVRFHPNNGGEDNFTTQNFIYGVAQNLATNTFTNGNLIFEKWTTNSNGTGNEYLDEEEITEGLSEIDGSIIDLYAQWRATEYWVTYYLGDESFTGENYINTNISLFDSTNINRDFEISMTLSNFEYLSGQNQNRNVILCNQNESTSPYQGFAFQYRDGGLMTQVNCTKVPDKKQSWGKTSGTIVISRTNNVLYQDGTSLFNFGNQITPFDLPLTIGANVDQYLVPRRFSKVDLSGISIRMKYTYEEYIQLYQNLPSPIKTGYRFGGWYTQANGGTEITSTAQLNSAGGTIYPHWVQGGFVVTFDSNGGTGSMEEEVVRENESKALTLNSFTKAGYTFASWNTSPDGTGKKYSDGEIVSNIENTTLYAQWLLEEKTEYSHVGPVHFDGSYTGIIDTGVNLFSEENIHKNFEIHFEIDSVDQMNNEDTLMNTKDESGSPYPGVVFRISTDGKYMFKADSNSNSTWRAYYQIASANVQKVRIVRINDISYYSINDEEFEVLMDFSDIVRTFNAPVAFGGIIKPDGSRSRGFKGTLSNLYVGFISDNASLEDYQDELEYTITYNLNGGTVTNPSTYTEETATFILSNPTKEGYTFKGWSGTDLTGDTNTTVTITQGSTGNRTYTANWIINASTGTILDLYDSTGNISDGLHIGDFINYDAGTWTAAEIANIQVGQNSSLVSANNLTSRPSETFQFGGFIAGMSRNTGAIEFDNHSYMYAKMYEEGDSSNQVALSGWRIFDINETTGEVTLISAANPEDYYNEYVVNSEYGYISEYILSGTKNSNWSEKDTAEDNYTKRNWSMYVNASQGATEAKVLTKGILDNWWTKYITNGINADTSTIETFQSIYSEPFIKYQNLIDNHARIWLSPARNSARLNYINPRTRSVHYDSSSYAFGIRILITLSADTCVQVEPTEKRVVTENEMIYAEGTYGSETTKTYNVWMISDNT